MTDIISVVSGFQSSVNIAYDINDESKLKNYIPTKSALKLLEDILLSTGKDATDRARILIGAYGKGKSHIVLMILSMLMKKDIGLFEKMIPMIQKENPALYQVIQNYYAGGDRILPVVITGSSNSLTQAFLLALQRTLAENGFNDIMPKTNYQAAVNTIERWRNDFPETYCRFREGVGESIDTFKNRLLDFDPVAYDRFENLYPSLTAGSSFNPFIGFDVADIYEEVAKALKIKGFTGVYVVYDEFSKYLENHITDATKSDTKMLQDFAEKCGRSGSAQMHLMLISHKEITSYIDRVSKAMVDGWRGVSERFRHIYLNNNFTQTYEIIAAAIVKNKEKWDRFIEEHRTEFQSLTSLYSKHPLFSDSYEESIERVIYDCYPLHPTSTFILPRLSERVAQNERTLFTFISASGDSTLSAFLNANKEKDFILATPDLIYDYFEPLLKLEVYSGSLHKYYMLTSSILRKVEPKSLDAKIVKTIALIYILEQFEKLQPTVDELNGIYNRYGTDAVNSAIKRLVEEKYVVYLKRSSNYLRLKETSGVDIREQISNMVEKCAAKLDIKSILNNSNFDHYLYPSRYNDEKEMTRYFDFRFVDGCEVREDTDWTVKRESIKADGAIFAIIPEEEKDILSIQEILEKNTTGIEDCVFVVPTKYQEIRPIVSEFNAVQILMQSVTDDPLLFEDYEIVYEDLRDVLRNYIETFTRPEKQRSLYVHNGEVKKISRRSDLTCLLSDICDRIYGLTPVVNNEAINKEEPTAVALNSRNKIMAGLLRSELEPNLGLTGNGQDVSIMRSTLLNNGIVTTLEGRTKINLEPEDELLAHSLSVIEDFILDARNSKNGVSFSALYKSLTGPENHIGMRRGLIPIYLSAVLHEYKKEIVISDRFSQVPINADIVEQINFEPDLFKVSYINWNPDKEAYLASLERIFNDYSIDDKSTVPYEHVMISMKRWYMALPKYAKNAKIIAGKKVSNPNRSFLQEMRKNAGSYDLIFHLLPQIYGADTVDARLAEEVRKTRKYFDDALGCLKNELVQKMRSMFCTLDTVSCEKMTLTSIIRDWCEKIDTAAFEHLFTDGTDRCLTLFREITNDEDLFITRVAKMATGLRLEDWDEDIIIMFEKNMKQYRDTAESFHLSEEIYDEPASIAEDYEISFKDEAGNTVTKRFSKVEESKRGKLLYNLICSQMDSMGQAISEQEKRQILMEILKEMC